MSFITNAVSSIFGGNQTPAAPDYTGAANATAQGNLDAARAAAAANRVNQVTPYGSLNYNQSGTDSYGNPTWTATTSLSDTGQQLLNNQNQTALGLGSTINSSLQNVQNTMSQPFNPDLPALQSNLETPNYQQVGQGPQFSQMGSSPDLQTKVGGTGMEGWDAATALINQRLQPQIQRQNEQSDAQLANQGIMPGSKAYNAAKQQLAQQQNDLSVQAQLQGQNVQNSLFNQNLNAGQFTNTALNQMNTNQLANTGFNNTTNQQGFTNQLAGTQANNAAIGQGFNNQLQNANLTNSANQQAYNQAMTNYNMPLNTLSALRSGAQVQNPTFINAPQQATTSGADLLGATTAAGNYNLGTSNANQAASSNLTGGLMNLGGTYMLGSMLSDIRTKQNIKSVGWLPNGLPVYEYEYKSEWKNEAGHGKFVGVMAQDVAKVQPEAIINRADGYMMVNYGALNA